MNPLTVLLVTLSHPKRLFEINWAKFGVTKSVSRTRTRVNVCLQYGKYTANNECTANNDSNDA